MMSTCVLTKLFKLKIWWGITIDKRATNIFFSCGLLCNRLSSNKNWHFQIAFGPSEWTNFLICTVNSILCSSHIIYKANKPGALVFFTLSLSVYLLISNKQKQQKNIIAHLLIWINYFFVQNQMVYYIIETISAVQFA